MTSQVAESDQSNESGVLDDLDAQLPTSFYWRLTLLATLAASCSVTTLRTSVPRSISSRIRFMDLATCTSNRQIDPEGSLLQPPLQSKTPNGTRPFVAHR